MQARYPDAEWRPLGTETEPAIKPRILVWHTMVGSLKGTDGYFRDKNGPGFSGPESHYGVGCDTDGALDGIGWQWQNNNNQADAQFDPGNDWCTSIENSDGGNPAHPFSKKQMEWHIRFALWWCDQTGIEPQIAKSYDGRGFAYHELFPQFNKSNHACPGRVREAQLRNYVWPEIIRRWNGKPPDPPNPPAFPEFPLKAGWYFGPENGPVESVSGYHGHAEDLAQWQRRMHDRGWSIVIDGHYGLQTQTIATRFQREKGLDADGLIGKLTWNAAWKRVVT
jgi:peptidoglycan hydrolase-like protein with peptidoglycan-binding domain